MLRLLKSLKPSTEHMVAGRLHPDLRLTRLVGVACEGAHHGARVAGVAVNRTTQSLQVIHMHPIVHEGD
jgi:hypothetical protein